MDCSLSSAPFLLVHVDIHDHLDRHLVGCDQRLGRYLE